MIGVGAWNTEPRVGFCFMRANGACTGYTRCAVCDSELPPTRPGDVVVAAIEDRHGRCEFIAIVGSCCLTEKVCAELRRLRAEDEAAAARDRSAG